MQRNMNEVQFITDPETGRVYPIPAGGSDEPPAGQPISGGDDMRSYFENSGGEESQQTPATTIPEDDGSQQETQQQQPSEEQQQADFSLAQRYLDGIEDPEVLQKLDPYVRKWDAGVTRRFQELRSQLRPYQELGDPDELSQAAQLYQVMSQDPERVYNALAQALGKAQQEAQQREQTPEPQRQQGEQDHFELPPEVQERLDRYETVLNHLAKNHLESQQQTQQQREDAELEEYLTNLKTEFGDYDETYVLSQMMAGKSGEEAVKAYQSLIEQNARQVNQAGEAPPVLSGGGSHAQQPINPGELSNKDTQSLVANLMAQAAKENS